MHAVGDADMTALHGHAVAAVACATVEEVTTTTNPASAAAAAAVSVPAWYYTSLKKLNPIQNSHTLGFSNNSTLKHLQLQ